MKVVRLTLALFGLVAATPLAANNVAELTFDQKMSQADLVVMATVDALRGQPGSDGSSATLSVVRTLKGRAPSSINAVTYSDIAELNPECCELGGTYIMFLVRTPNGRLASVQGRYGMVRIGAPRTHLESRLHDATGVCFRRLSALNREGVVVDRYESVIVRRSSSLAKDIARVDGFFGKRSDLMNPDLVANTWLPALISDTAIDLTVHEDCSLPAITDLPIHRR